ncbi:endonuclease/exonuclease/phosphatase family protein [Microtetraspora niveoalba]|uniref:endonuclease/exonuclease/phosphatase family protein n=1 Tax=Microtetraspora niveoalba TaxID=46175 RepID=UPI00082A7773|nr:endonuclease/exonuclease/phosphatase family protein [Microtetraspora niveoalba]
MRPPRFLLIALIAAPAFETLRFAFPSLAHLADTAGYVPLAGVIAALALAPLLVLPLRRLAGPAVVLLTGAGALVAVRLAVLVHGPAVPLGVAAGAVALFTTACLLSAAPPAALPYGLQAGAAVDLVVRLCFTTWDPIGQRSLPALLFSGAVPLVLALAAARLARPVPGTAEPGDAAARDRTVAVAGAATRGLIAVGPWFALHLVILTNPAALAAAAGLPLRSAGLLLLAAQATTLLAMRAARALPSGTPRAITAGASLLGLPAVSWALTGPDGAVGPVVVPLVVLGGWLAGIALALAVRPGGAGSGTLTAWVGLLALVVVVFGYQMSYLVPLGLPGSAFAALAAAVPALTALAGVRERGGSRPASWAALRAASWPPLGLVLLAAPVLLLAMPADRTLSGTGEPVPAGGLRVISYNIHEGTAPSGRLDPEAIAATLERLADGPSVILLQEVGRGWPTSGTTDLATWLAERLGMRMAYTRAAENAFGLAVLTDVPVVDVRGARLPHHPDALQDRAVLQISVRAANRTYTLAGTHLSHESSVARLREIDGLLARVRDTTLVVGDLNAAPGSPEIARLTGGGLGDAGDAGPATFPETGERIDWILTGRAVELVPGSHRVAESVASDHLPISVVIRTGDAPPSR